MHGVVFAALRDYSFETLGRERAEELWFDRTFSPTEVYDDEWFAAQLDRIAAAKAEPRDAVARDFGVHAARTTFVDLYPDYYATASDVFDFLLGLEEQIHESVRAELPGAQPPRLSVQRLDEGVQISYESERRLCSVLEGLVHGVAAKLGPAVDTDETECMLRGGSRCVFTVVASDRG